jgi:hypothetical protein
MEPEDGLIWAHDPADEEAMVFTDFGIELQELIAIHRDRTD